MMEDLSNFQLKLLKSIADNIENAAVLTDSVNPSDYLITFQCPSFRPPTLRSNSSACSFCMFLSTDRSVIPINLASSGIVICFCFSQTSKIISDVFPTLSRRFPDTA